VPEEVGEMDGAVALQDGYMSQHTVTHEEKGVGNPHYPTFFLVS
jgi:hypothetical protein